MLDEQHNQRETVNHQPLQRRNARGHQDINTTWDSSSSEEVGTTKHQYEAVLSEKGYSNSQRNLIKEVARTIGPNRQPHLQPHEVREHEGPIDYPRAGPQYQSLAGRADGGPHRANNSFTHELQNETQVQDGNRRANYAGHDNTVYHSTPKQLPTRPLTLGDRNFTSETDRLDTHTMDQARNQMMSEQENRRESINLQMANIMKLNSRLDSLGANNSIYGTLGPKGINDREHFHMINIVASTSPEMLHQDYATRLAMMSRIEERLGEVLKEKSEQVNIAKKGASIERALEASRISLRQLGEPATQDLSNLPLTEYRRLQRY